MAELLSLQVEDFLYGGLNFDLDLWEANSEILAQLRAFVTNFMKLGLLLSEKSQQASRTNKQTNKQTRVMTIPPGRDNNKHVQTFDLGRI